VQLNITNLAGVPSVVYGILGLTAFVQMFGLFGGANHPQLEFGVSHYLQYATENPLRFVRVPVGRRDAPSAAAIDGMTAYSGSGRRIALRVIEDDAPAPSDPKVAAQTPALLGIPSAFRAGITCACRWGPGCSPAA
jgi:phosphate transport system permease protein